MPKNPCGKMRPVDNPYEIWSNKDKATNSNLWEWHVLKKYKQPSSEAKDPYARWFCAVYSPITREQMSQGYELGDVYVTEVKDHATLVEESVNYDNQEDTKQEIHRNLTRHRGAKLVKECKDA